MFLLNLQGKTPIFEQIQSQIVTYIKAGVLKPGDKLPSVREFAADNGINPNTVAKAYQQLEKNGYVYNVYKKGVFVADIDLAKSTMNQILTVLKPLKESGYQKEELLMAIEQLYGGDSDAED